MNHVIHPMSSADIRIFQRKSETFFISRNTDIDFILYIISNSFNFLLVFKDSFDKRGCNFHDVSKIDYSRPS